MDLTEAVERISHKMESKGKKVERSKIESKMRLLVEDFGVNMAEAERTVMNDLAKEYSVNLAGAQNADRKEIGALMPGEWVTIEGKCVALIAPPSPAISQTGILADTTGAIRFVVWARAEKPPMEQGRWYRIESAVVDEYRGAPKLNIHSGTTISPVDQDIPIIPSMHRVAELRPGVASVRVKMIQEWEPSHPRMLQTGLVGDASGIVKFTIWNEEGKEKLQPDTVYSIYYALVDEYAGRLQLNLSSALYLPEEGDIQVWSGEKIVGALVHIAPGSGLVKRCPVEGCNRVLSRQNYCSVHEIQKNFRYDLRIKGVLDDSERACNVLFPCELVESLTGIRLEEAIELAEGSPLGMDEVFFRLRDAMLGRYFSCTGTEIEDRTILKDCQWLAYEPKELAALLNRAGGA
ncbi:MAG: nucleotide-binding protein [Methanomicrobiales archaeon]|nr:nucleotide-binding protein [Methanomicrobiales archaeon]